MNLTRIAIGTLSAAVITLGLAGTAVAAPPAPPNCTAPGLAIAIGNATTHVVDAQSALVTAQAALAGVVADPLHTAEQLAAAQQAVTDAQAALVAAQDHVTHLGLVSVKVASNRCHLPLPA